MSSAINSSIDSADPSHTSLEIPDWPRAWGEPCGTAVMRSRAEDFRVDEVLGFEPDGEGEHLLLQVRKRNLNTEQVARSLARAAGVKARDVSYGGLKDRVAVTSQWFSVWLPGKADPDWSPIVSDDLQILQQARHRRKLPRGALQANRFEIVLREVQAAPDDIEQRLTKIRASGVPNYFGAQRFGHAGRNVSAAQAMFDGAKIRDKHLRGLYLSAARSFLFNQVLAARVVRANWNQILPGEAVMLMGSRSFFVTPTVDAEIETRLAQRDIAPSAPLWGKGESPAQADALRQEAGIEPRYAGLCDGLAAAGLKQERRALRLDVGDLQWHWIDARTLVLRFELPTGAYATTVLRELLETGAADG